MTDIQARIDMVELLKKEIFNREDCLKVAKYWIDSEELYARTRFEDIRGAEVRLSSAIQCARVDGYKEAITQSAAPEVVSTTKEIKTELNAVEKAYQLELHRNIQPKQELSTINDELELYKDALQTKKNIIEDKDAKIAELQKENEWRDISLAPIDGTEFLAISKGHIERTIEINQEGELITVNAPKRPFICWRCDDMFRDEFGELYRPDGYIIDVDDEEIKGQEDIHLRLARFRLMPEPPEGI